jgi:hypothetical protein
MIFSVYRPAYGFKPVEVSGTSLRAVGSVQPVVLRAVVQPGERSGQRALLSVERFNKLAASCDMNSILMNAAADQQPNARAATPAWSRDQGWSGPK